MLRSHRILRDANRIRKARRPLAVEPSNFDLAQEHRFVCQNIREAEGDDILPPHALDAFEARLGLVMLGVIKSHADEFAQITDDVAGRVYGGKDYANRLDRQLNVGSAALVSNAVQERVLACCWQVLFRLVRGDYEIAPARNPTRPV